MAHRGTRGKTRVDRGACWYVRVCVGVNRSASESRISRIMWGATQGGVP